MSKTWYFMHHISKEVNTVDLSGSDIRTRRHPGNGGRVTATRTPGTSLRRRLGYGSADPPPRLAPGSPSRAPREEEPTVGTGGKKAAQRAGHNMIKDGLNSFISTMT
ncbi:unnamed protein product [Caretta caretta]